MPMKVILSVPFKSKTHIEKTIRGADWLSAGVLPCSGIPSESTTCVDHVLCSLPGGHGQHWNSHRSASTTSVSNQASIGYWELSRISLLTSSPSTPAKLHKVLRSQHTQRR